MQLEFHAVGNDVFRSLMVARLSFPSSKRATVEYLKSCFNEDHDLHKIYRYLDTMVADDAKWNGLKGYVSNATLSSSAIVEAYHQLYNVEQSFRISKSKLEIRPISHFNEDRIMAHVSISFVALKVCRELDRMLKNNNMKLSVDTVLNIGKTIPAISVKMAEGTLTKTLFLTKWQQLIKPLFEEKFWWSQTSSEKSVSYAFFVKKCQSQEKFHELLVSRVFLSSTDYTYRKHYL